ncbi:hypothetical protein AVEN_205918-1 [Araneus ventricosus]|uniref:Uncharacterized protein n=1 Tax=Araneus ventricosus TaxID=182803 RepID=A0A4Y2HHC1_ARAVE|nr:hypothetical protein AVEN_205918-1 [Araneus ventricosus]
MLDFEIILLESLDPASYLAFSFLKIRKPSQGNMISKKKFPSTKVFSDEENGYDFINASASNSKELMEENVLLNSENEANGLQDIQN